MVFFNYSTMQMAAKVVYYGPGLCGKTTNLHFIYGHTTSDSRGEMVSLETETDRTLFFDLLPIDVGSIAGFNTRIQLYTVPGQVFYNTTRKLVLKGVDGIVFVADSQRAMLQANAEAFRNLEENLAEMGLSADTLPLVLQYNKRDLPDILSVEEMNEALNRGNWPHVEACAVSGVGVFETLKEISRVTLLSLKKRLSRPEAQAAPPRPPAPRPPVQTPAPAPVEAVASPPPPQIQRPVSTAHPVVTPPPPPGPPVLPQPAPRLTTPAAPPPPPIAPKPATARKGSLDVLGELEKLRQGTKAPAPTAAAKAAGTNGRHELSRNIEMSLKRSDLQRAKRVLISFQVEDDQNQVMDSVRDLPVEITDAASLEKLLLHFNIALNAKE
jgi:mutual gliding-motility protein MglA